MTEKILLRRECVRFFKCETLSDSLELLDTYIELLFQIVKNHHEEPVYTNANADAKTIVQMILTKSLNIKNVVNGIDYKSKDGYKLNHIIDPTVVACLIRNLYETVSMFNLIYRSSEASDERDILYCLWVHAGLKYRQRFESVISTEENQLKFEEEKKTAEEYLKFIENTELYKRLDKKNQDKINDRIKRKEYLVRIIDEKVEFLHWQKLSETMQIRADLFDNIYTYFSQYAHPTNVSVFQFEDMFKKGAEEFGNMTNFNLKYYFALTSIFIADYINLFPTTLQTYENMNIRDQIVVNFNNTLMRGQDFSINNSASYVD